MSYNPYRQHRSVEYRQHGSVAFAISEDGTSLDFHRTDTVESLNEALLSLNPEERSKVKCISFRQLSKLQALPETLQLFTELEDLYVPASVSSLPDFIVNCTNLKSLHCSLKGNAAQFFETLSGLERLEHLDLLVSLEGEEAQEGLTDKIGALRSLKVLSINNTSEGLMTLPEGIASLRSLEVLNVYRCLTLPAGIGALRSLKVLNASGLTTLPDEIGLLENLEEIHLSSLFDGLRGYREAPAEQGITSLPESICNLKKLRELDLRRHRLDALPENLGDLESLEVLDLHTEVVVAENPIECLPSSICRLHKLRRLDLGGLGLSVLPEGIGGLRSLTEFVLPFNNLEVLPEGMGELSNLETLVVDHNRLTTFPESIEKLKQLRVLSAHNNQIASLPAEIAGCHSLKELVLRYNRLTELPLSLFDLHGLETLSLGHNRLVSLSERIGNLVNLQGLDLDHNQLTELPTSIATLPGYYLHAFDNPLQYLPDSFLMGDLSENLSPDVLHISRQHLRALQAGHVYEAPPVDPKVRANAPRVDSLQTLCVATVHRHAEYFRGLDITAILPPQCLPHLNDRGRPLCSVGPHVIDRATLPHCQKVVRNRIYSGTIEGEPYWEQNPAEMRCYYGPERPPPSAPLPHYREDHNLPFSSLLCPQHYGAGMADLGGAGMANPG